MSRMNLKAILRPIYMNFGGPAIRMFMLNSFAKLTNIPRRIYMFWLKVDSVLRRYTVYQIIDKVTFRLERKLARFGIGKSRARQKTSTMEILTNIGKPAIKVSRLEVDPQLAFPEQRYSMVMCIPFTGRYHIMEVVIAEFFASQGDDLPLGVALAGSDPSDLDFAEKMKKKYGHIAYQNCENFPLGRKAQLSLDLAKSVKHDAVLMNGSDDILSASYVRSCLKYVQLGSIDFVAPIVWYTYNAAPKSSTYGAIWRTHYTGSAAGSSLGAGRGYSAEFLKKIDYEVFATSIDIHLDTKMEEMASSGAIRTVHPSRDDGPIVSVKGDWDKLNEIDSLLDNCPTVRFADVEFETSSDVEEARRIRNSFTGVNKSNTQFAFL